MNVICRKCGSEANEKDKICPYCSVKDPGRRWWHFVFPIAAIALVIVGLRSCPDIPNSEVQTNKTNLKYENVTLKQWRAMEKEVRLKFIHDFLGKSDISVSASPNFYKCISQHSYTKEEDMSINQSLDWCLKDYKIDPNLLSKMINFDVFKSNVRSLDSSYRPLIIKIKNNMNDPSSFKHLETGYRFVLNKNAPYAVVNMTYQGKNDYGALVKEKVTARVDLNSGEIIESH